MQTLKTVAEVQTRIKENNPNDIFLDVRTPDEFAGEHIQGAINLDISNPNMVNELANLDKSKNYVVYCRSGGRSQMASLIMDQKGLTVINCGVGFMRFGGSSISVTK